MKITETCCCGARFEIESRNEMAVAIDVVNFRDAHEICRQTKKNEIPEMSWPPPEAVQDP